MQQLLGMRLEEAEAILRQQGVEPQVIFTCAPRNARKEGEKRVIRVRGSELTVSLFQVELPSE